MDKMKAGWDIFMASLGGIYVSVALFLSKLYTQIFDYTFKA